MPKVCKACGATKFLREFHRSPSTKDGYQSTCKQCRNQEKQPMSRSEAGRLGYEGLVRKYGVQTATAIIKNETVIRERFGKDL